MTVAEALQQGTALLRQHGSPTARLDAEVLLAHALGRRRVELYVRPEQALLPAEEERYRSFLARRAGGEPVSYIVGRKEFFGLSFAVDRRVLIPRPETEVLVARALECARLLAKEDLAVADIGTGSGCISAALAVHLPGARIWATDASPAALAVAQSNLLALGLAERVRLLQGDLCAPLPERVDLLVSNPPYTVWADLPAGITAHEPRLALDGGDDGLAVYRRLLPQIAAHLQAQGWALLEVGDGQAAEVLALAAAALPGASLRAEPDYSGIPRVVEIGPVGT